MHVLNIGVLEEELLELARVNVLTSANDRILTSLVVVVDLER